MYYLLLNIGKSSIKMKKYYATFSWLVDVVKGNIIEMGRSPGVRSPKSPLWGTPESGGRSPSKFEGLHVPVKFAQIISDLSVIFPTKKEENKEKICMLFLLPYSRFPVDSNGVGEELGKVLQARKTPFHPDNFSSRRPIVLIRSHAWTILSFYANAALLQTHEI